MTVWQGSISLKLTPAKHAAYLGKACVRCHLTASHPYVPFEFFINATHCAMDVRNVALTKRPSGERE